MSAGVAGARSLGVYPVNYPADDDFAASASAGAGDASAHVQSMVADCPKPSWCSADIPRAPW
ncbi:hypothetical protein MAHJHV51_45300 [Mycobacterium avium subsp. hominissuis]